MNGCLSLLSLWPVSAAAVCLVLLVWLSSYLCAMAPRRGTLEWISRERRGPVSGLPSGALQAGGWQAAAAAGLLGAATMPIRLMTLSMGQLPLAALSALLAAAFCLLLLQLDCGAAAGLLGTALLLCTVMPQLPLLPQLLALGSACCLASLLAGRRGGFLAAAFSAVLAAASAWWMPACLLLGPLYALAFGLFRALRGRRGLAALWGALLLLAAFALAVPAARFAALRLQDAWSGNWHDLLPLLPIPALPAGSQLPLLLPLLAVPVCLIQGLRLRDGPCLASGLLGLSLGTLCLFGAEEIGCAGGLLALGCTFSGGWRRGKKPWVCACAGLLGFCILLLGGISI